MRDAPDIAQFGCIAEPAADNKRFLDGSPIKLTVFEPLCYKAPSIARPYCCYIKTVIFHVYPHVVTKSGNFLEWGRTECLLGWDDEFIHQFKIYRCGGGRVIRRNGSWWMRHWAHLRIEGNRCLSTEPAFTQKPIL